MVSLTNNSGLSSGLVPVVSVACYKSLHVNCVIYTGGQWKNNPKQTKNSKLNAVL